MCLSSIVISTLYLVILVQRPLMTIFIDHIALAKQGDNAPVRLSVCLWRSALRTAAKSDRSYYQSKVFVCVSVISRRMQIVARSALSFLISLSWVLGSASKQFPDDTCQQRDVKTLGP